MNNMKMLYYDRIDVSYCIGLIGKLRQKSVFFATTDIA